MSTFSEVLSALMKSNHKVIDDNDALPLALNKVVHITELNKKAVALYEGKDFALREMYVDSLENVHVSRVSIGSMFFARKYSLAMAMKNYNAFRCTWNPHHIARIISLENPASNEPPAEVAVVAPVAP